MDVFIHSIGSALPAAPVKKTAVQDSSERDRSDESVASGDAVEASLQLRAMTENVLAAPIVDAAHVQRVSNAIASGQYQIDPQNAANRLVEIEALTP